MVVRPSLGEKSKGNHEFFREGVTKYKHPLLESTIPCAYKGKRPPRQRQSSSGNSNQTPRKSSKSPAKYSHQNSQNREVVAKSKDDAAVSSIGFELAAEDEDLGSGSDSDFDFTPSEYKDFGCSSIVLGGGHSSPLLEQTPEEEEGSPQDLSKGGQANERDDTGDDKDRQPGSSMTTAQPIHARTSPPTAAAAVQPPAVALMKAAMTSEEEQMSLALEISKLDMATEEEQIAHALKLSMKEFKPPLQEHHGFTWPCDEEENEAASDETDDETSNSSCTTVTESSTSANNRLVQEGHSSSEGSTPSVLHVTRPYTKAELKAFLSNLGEVAYYWPQLRESHHILSRLLHRAKKRGGKGSFRWGSKQETDWHKIQNTLGPRPWPKIANISGNTNSPDMRVKPRPSRLDAKPQTPGPPAILMSTAYR